MTATDPGGKRNWSSKEWNIVTRFARAILRKSKEEALLCVQLLEEYENLDGVCAGGVVELDGRPVYLPDYLHEETARMRFREERIEGF
ncbi:MAG: hypothetical protein A2939_00675 [Parcubacteria group bacterium RIFCSPLOWO2_01_FULL_48_18]|nr:MAG: hypothetical protein A2939_00675 [Parcubacteria group bacterium RIFCSPLOWO2_01_FULL_48_18]OHB22876.1 MAG: hypothetical protein A3J67_01175 [Parcubacteria group bacterium RIFCSPHIGHO2_02_FULL_48_10b]